MSGEQADNLTGTILVVDDTSHVRHLLAAMLASRGHRVETADGGPQALEMVQAQPPDVILLDIMMPNMDGYEVCERLKADPQTWDIPIIFISALEQTEDIVKAFNTGGVDYVPKPFQVKEVLARVNAHLSLRVLQKQLWTAKELDTFAEAIAQDLKTPLTALIGFADMLRMMHATMPDEQLEETVRAISSSGHKMNKIINELLLLAGLRQAQQVDLEVLDMTGVVAMALTRLSDVIKEHKAEVTLPEGWPKALGYRPWVEEVWVNYIRSAIEQGGRPPRVELGSTSESDGDVRFWVRDRRPGLSGEAGPSALPSFGAPSEKERGLGMFVVRRMMERLGKDASVERTKDQGSVFSFTLRRE